MGKKKNRPEPPPPPLPDPSFVYSRARWRHGIRVFGVGILLLLNVSMVGSLSTRRTNGHPIPWSSDLQLIGLVLFCDISVLLPMLVEVDKAQALEDKLVLNTMFWKAKIPYEAIVSFKSPVYLKFSIVRTRRCFYLLNKRQLEKYDQLAKVIDIRRNVPAIENTGNS
jgi:hypothetical protein